MKVIKPGRSFRVTCEHCGALLLADPEDIKMQTLPQSRGAYKGPIRTIKYVVCPCCNRGTHIE